MKERVLKAFLDLVILRFLEEKPMTGYEVNRLLVKKHGLMLAPNTINSKLSAMERSGWTKRIRNRHGKTYSLTDKGQEKVDSMPSITAEIHAAIKTMLGN